MLVTEHYKQVNVSMITNGLDYTINMHMDHTNMASTVGIDQLVHPRGGATRV